MFHKLCVLLLVVLITPVLLGQKNFQPGYVVNTPGDTLEGFIDYKNWLKNPESITFQNVLDGAEMVYKPLNIKSFGVNDEIYRSATVDLEMSPVKTGELSASPDLVLKTEIVFLQVLFEGERALYYFMDSQGKEHFYMEVDEGYEWLVYKRYYKAAGGSFTMGTTNVIAENNKYKGQLAYYLNNCESLANEINRLEYKKADLTALFMKYYQCMHAEYLYALKPENNKAGVGVLAGPTLNNLSVTGSEGFEEIGGTDFKTTGSVTFGLFLDKKLSRNLGRFSFNNELILCYFKTTGTYTAYENENKYKTIDYTLGTTSINLNLMFRYSFQMGRHTRMYSNVGLANGFVIQEINEAHTFTKFYTTEREETTPAISDIKGYELGFLGGIGGTFRDYSLEIRFVIGNGLSNQASLKSSVGRLSLLFGYRF